MGFQGDDLPGGTVISPRSRSGASRQRKRQHGARNYRSPHGPFFFDAGTINFFAAPHNLELMELASTQSRERVGEILPASNNSQDIPSYDPLHGRAGAAVQNWSGQSNFQ
jgi:hypothetical protein